VTKSLVSLLAILLIGFAGCGKRDESLAKQAGSKVGETITDFASGVGKGVDKQMLVTVDLAKPLVEAGVAKTVAKSTGMNPDQPRGITVYLTASKPLKAKLVAKALSKDGQEVGRSVVDVEFTADDAKYVTFKFDREMDSQLVDKYLIDLKK
jgi:hypothetical protein